jgi:hypothetical protein
MWTVTEDCWLRQTGIRHDTRSWKGGSRSAGQQVPWFYGTRIFITLFTEARQWSIPSQFNPVHNFQLRLHVSGSLLSWALYHLSLEVQPNTGGAVAQAVTHRQLSTAEARGRIQSSPCGIYTRQSGTGKVFLRDRCCLLSLSFHCCFIFTHVWSACGQQPVNSRSYKEIYSLTPSNHYSTTPA